MYKRPTLAESSSSATSSNVSSNSSREGSSGHTSSTSASSGTDAINTASRRKTAAKPQSMSGNHAQSQDNRTAEQPSTGKSERQRSVTAFLNKLFRYVGKRKRIIMFQNIDYVLELTQAIFYIILFFIFFIFIHHGCNIQKYYLIETSFAHLQHGQ